MQALTQAIYTALAADGTLTANLDVYASLPAIFSGGITPKSFQLSNSSDKAYILIQPPVLDVDNGAKEHELRTLTQDILITTRVRTSLAFIDSVAQRVRTLLHKELLTVTGHSSIIALASGPIFIGQFEDQLTYVVTLTTTLKPN